MKNSLMFAFSRARVAAWIRSASLVCVAGVSASGDTATQSSKGAKSESAGPGVAAGNERVRRIMETYEGRGTLADSTPMTAAEDAVRSFAVREGLVVDLLAAEPAVQQPLYMNWDSKGRLWVTQYLQYQFPAGLKVVSYDAHLRAQFDRVPQPPPKGVTGADKVTVFEDTDGDGVFDTHRDVISGLNIASAALPGAGAIWVLNPPYLLRYPDNDGDGSPDADPEVAVSGFGIEDTHSVANSLQWGVDGWLYGAHGSTCTANVSSAATKNLRWEGQCIWRYDPESKRIEIFAEGGGNTFSLDIDSKGRMFSGTNAGGTRGMHYEQGSYGSKSWGKHGPLTNPHAHGWFEHMSHEGDKRRFPQAFAVYEGGLLGPGFEGRIVAPNSLANLVYLSERVADGSTFSTRDEAPLLTSPDRWFRPVDAKVGPDGAVYLADWYDTRLSHVRPVDDWHKASGRIYRVRPQGASMARPAFNLHTAPEAELFAYLSHANRWFRRQAALEVGWRKLTGLESGLRAAVLEKENPHALDALYALDMLGGVDSGLLLSLLTHGDPYVRRWAVRIAGEKGSRWEDCVRALESLARVERHAEVRAQLLATSKRLPGRAGLALLHAALGPMGEGEKRLPLLAWWALESKCGIEPATVVGFLGENREFFAGEFFAQHLAERLGRRLASGADAAHLEAAGAVYTLFAKSEARLAFVEGVAGALEGATPTGLPGVLAEALSDLERRRDGGAVVSELRAGKPGSLDVALKVLADGKAHLRDRLAIAKALAGADHPGSVPVLNKMLIASGVPPVLKRALLNAAVRYSGADIPGAVLASYESKIAGDPLLRDAALRALAGRMEWAEALVDAVEESKVPARHIQPDVVGTLAQHREKSPRIRAALERLWAGVLGGISPEDKAKEAARLRGVLGEGLGAAESGRQLFGQLCASCHKLFGEGNSVGPELTPYERSNPSFWIDNIVYPSLEIREGFGLYNARTHSGQVMVGMLDAEDAEGVVLRDFTGQKTRIRRGEIAALEANPVSLMPEALLSGLSAVQIRDLFAYLMLPVAPAGEKR